MKWFKTSYFHDRKWNITCDPHSESESTWQMFWWHFKHLWAVQNTELQREQFEPHNQNWMNQLELTAFRQIQNVALWSGLTNLNCEWHLNTTSGWNEYPLICICSSSSSASRATCRNKPVTSDPKAMSKTEISISAGSTATFPAFMFCEDTVVCASTAGTQTAPPRFH